MNWHKKKNEHVIEILQLIVNDRLRIKSNESFLITYNLFCRVQPRQY